MGTLSLYPFGVKEGPILHFLKYVPFGLFSLSMYLLDHFSLRASVLRGPRDLGSMRAAANGKSREEGFAAMAVEAQWLEAGKPPKEEGSIKASGIGFRA